MLDTTYCYGVYVLHPVMPVVPKIALSICFDTRCKPPTISPDYQCDNLYTTSHRPLCRSLRPRISLSPKPAVSTPPPACQPPACNSCLLHPSSPPQHAPLYLSPLPPPLPLPRHTPATSPFVLAIPDLPARRPPALLPTHPHPRPRLCSPLRPVCRR